MHFRIRIDEVRRRWRCNRIRTRRSAVGRTLKSLVFLGHPRISLSPTSIPPVPSVKLRRRSILSSIEMDQGKYVSLASNGAVDPTQPDRSFRQRPFSFITRSSSLRVRTAWLLVCGSPITRPFSRLHSRFFPLSPEPQPSLSAVSPPAGGPASQSTSSSQRGPPSHPATH